jgi:hypothetical protein
MQLIGQDSQVGTYGHEPDNCTTFQTGVSGGVPAISTHLPSGMSNESLYNKLLATCNKRVSKPKKMFSRSGRSRTQQCCPYSQGSMQGYVFVLALCFFCISVSMLLVGCCGEAVT